MNLNGLCSSGSEKLREMGIALVKNTKDIPVKAMKQKLKLSYSDVKMSLLKGQLVEVKKDAESNIASVYAKPENFVNEFFVWDQTQ